jgi:hypothetical protein
VALVGGMRSFWNGLGTLLADFGYLAPLQTWLFRRRHPGEEIIVSRAAKASRFSQDEEVRIGGRWVVARRRALIATKKRLVCGDWDIPVPSIQAANLLRIRSMLRFDAYVLKVATISGEHYQFGLMHDPAWETRMPFVVTVEQGNIGWTLSGVLLNLVVLALIAFMIFQIVR